MEISSSQDSGSKAACCNIDMRVLQFQRLASCASGAGLPSLDVVQHISMAATFGHYVSAAGDTYFQPQLFFSNTTHKL